MGRETTKRRTDYRKPLGTAALQVRCGESEKPPNEMSQKCEQQYPANSTHPNQEVERKPGRINFFLVHGGSLTVTTQMSFCAKGWPEHDARVRFCSSLRPLRSKAH